MTEDIDIDQLPPGLVLGSHQTGGAVVILSQIVKVATDLIGQMQRVENRIFGEQPPVIGRNVETGVPRVDGPEQPPEVLPDRLRVIAVAMFVGFPDRVSR